MDKENTENEIEKKDKNSQNLRKGILIGTISTLFLSGISVVMIAIIKSRE